MFFFITKYEIRCISFQIITIEIRCIPFQLITIEIRCISSQIITMEVLFKHVLKIIVWKKPGHFI